jgi:hypothetical protein
MPVQSNQSKSYHFGFSSSCFSFQKRDEQADPVVSRIHEVEYDHRSTDSPHPSLVGQAARLHIDTNNPVVLLAVVLDPTRPMSGRITQALPSRGLRRSPTRIPLHLRDSARSIPRSSSPALRARRTIIARTIVSSPHRMLNVSSLLPAVRSAPGRRLAWLLTTYLILS